MSTVRPHSKRDRSRSSRNWSSWGGQSLLMTICFCRVVERVERVEELDLCAFAAGQKLDVVHQQDVRAAVLRPEIQGSVEADGVDHLVHEAVGRDVGSGGLRRMEVQVLADGVHEVGFSESGAAVEEKRVVGPSRGLGDGAGGRVRKLVRRSDDEFLEGVASVRRRCAGRRLNLIGSGRPGRISGGRSGVGRHERDDGFRLTELVGRLLDDPGIVSGQPILEAVVGHEDRDLLILVLDEPGGLEHLWKMYRSTLFSTRARIWSQRLLDIWRHLNGFAARPAGHDANGSVERLR